VKRIAIPLAVVLTTSCQPTKSDEKTETNVDETSSGSLAVESSNDLKLSESISPEVPQSVAAKGGGEASTGSLSVEYLVAPKKSAEACYIRDRVREAKMNIESIAMNLCYMEAQKGMKVGKKYKMKMPTMAMLKLQDGGMPDMGSMPTSGDPMSGSAAPTGQTMDPNAMQSPGAMPTEGAGGDMPDMPETMSIWMDDSTKGKLTVYVCQDDKLTEKYEIDRSSKTARRGSFKIKVGDGNTMDVRMAGVYENSGEEGDRSKVATDMSFKMSMGTTSMYAKSSMFMNISKKEISELKIASETSMSMGDFSNAQKEIGAALIGPNFGSALLQRTFDGSSNPSMFGASTSGSSQSIETSRAYFDSAGNQLTAESNKNFAEGGLLYLDAKALPKLLPESFDVKFDSTDWDCSGTEDFTLDMENADFKKCDDRFAAAFSDETCSGADYGAGVAFSDAPVVVNERSSETPDFDSLEDLTTAPVLGEEETTTDSNESSDDQLEEDVE